MGEAGGLVTDRSDELIEWYADEDQAHDDDEPTTWEPLDLGPWLAGERQSPVPSVGISRTDGKKLIYAGREHTVFGETEAGKSWFALESAAVEMRMGRDVVYIHYEEGDPGSTIERLQLLSVTPEQIRKHLRFVAPARPVRGAWLDPLLDPPPALVIHDGVNEGMSLHGDDTNAADGAATFRRNIIKPFLAVGAASLSCDHVTKGNGENRGRYAIGSGHKINAVDGAAFLMENIEPFGRGLRGASRVYITKDRPGQLRAHGKPTTIPGKTFFGVLAVDARPEAGPDFLTFFAPRDDDAQESNTGPEERLGEIICDTIAALPQREVGAMRTLLAHLRNAGHQFRDMAVRDALDDLVAAGQLMEYKGRRNALGYRLTTASRTQSETTASPTASASASPIGGEAGSSRVGSASEAVGSSGKQSKPQRLKRSRAKGWRKPDGAVIVDRTSRWGNPYRVGAEAADNFDAVAKFRRHLNTHPDLVVDIRRELAGRDLVCACEPNEPCHADVLLEVANQ